MSEDRDLVIKEDFSPANPYASIGAFKEIQRMAQLVSQSDLMPPQFKNNIPNTVIALEMAVRMNASPLAVMQNLYVVRGKPGWAGKFVMALIKSCGLYRGVYYDIGGDDSNKTCMVIATSVATGAVIKGPMVSYEMAKKEGWWDKGGSKWQTMPELLIRYRAASFFGNTECPEILCGLPTTEELHDTPSLTDETKDSPASVSDEINDAICEKDTKKEEKTTGDQLKEKPLQHVSTGQPPSFSPAAKAILDVADKAETAKVIDDYRGKPANRKKIDGLGDEAGAVYQYIENAYQALKGQ